MFTHRTIRFPQIFARCKIVQPNLRLVSTYSTPATTTDQNWQPYGTNRHSQSAHCSEQEDAFRSRMEPKRRATGSHTAKRRKIDQPALFLPEGSNDEVLAIEIMELLSQASLENQNGHSEPPAPTSDTDKADTAIIENLAGPFKLQEQVELDIIALSSTGDGLAYSPSKDHIVVIPFSVPGDRVLAKIYKSFTRHSLADFIKIITPSPQREGVTPACRYFAKCSGCQFQMLPYETQLEHKRGIVEKAFKHFSGMKAGQIPEVEPTMGSPLQYKYRTKLTPHFTRPFSRKYREWDTVPNIGFNMKGKREVMDIESCPIGTEIVQEGLKIERQRVKDTIQTFKNGATVLLRESTQRTYTSDPSTAAEQTNGSENNNKSNPSPSSSIPSNPLDLDLQSTKLSHTPTTTITNTYPTHTDIKTYTSSEKSLATEYVTVTTDPTTTPPTTRTYEFTNTAGSFFQNNNAILGLFTSYIYSQCLPTGSKTPENDKPIKYLLDAYSGSGLFTLTLSPLFTSSLGIDIDPRSISAARSNASANNLSNTTGFMDADAAALFADVPYPPDQTLLVIDPPRKGCDRAFLRQLRLFGPRRVVYVSCNVHSQARDVGVLVNGFVKRGGQGVSAVVRGNDDVSVMDEEWEMEGKDGAKLWRYEIETLRGFDFFPQTGHVEGVCILNRVG